MEKQYQLFVSYSSEHRHTLVRPLCLELARRGIKVWYDEFELAVGDSLRKKIDHGLAASEYGLVIVTPEFFTKNWTDYEYGALTAKQMTGKKTILPILYNVSREDLLSVAPGLADLVYLEAHSMSILELAQKIEEYLTGRVLGTELWKQLYTVGTILDLSAYPVSTELRVELQFGTIGLLQRPFDSRYKHFRVSRVDEGSRSVLLEVVNSSANPWQGAEFRYKGKKTAGVVLEVKPHAIEVELEPGLVATLPREEATWQQIDPDLSALFKINDPLFVDVLEVDENARCIVLTLLSGHQNDNFEAAQQDLVIGDEIQLIFDRTNNPRRGILASGVTFRIREFSSVGVLPISGRRNKPLWKAMPPVVLGFDATERAVVVGTYLDLRAGAENWPIHTQTLEIRNKLGLYAIGSAGVSKIAIKYPCQIVVSRVTPPIGTVSAYNPMQLIRLATREGVQLEIQARGVDAEKALAHICKYIESIPYDWDTSSPLDIIDDYVRG